MFKKESLSLVSLHLSKNLVYHKMLLCRKFTIQECYKNSMKLFKQLSEVLDQSWIQLHVQLQVGVNYYEPVKYNETSLITN